MKALDSTSLGKFSATWLRASFNSTGVFSGLWERSIAPILRAYIALENEAYLDLKLVYIECHPLLLHVGYLIKSRHRLIKHVTSMLSMFTMVDIGWSLHALFGDNVD